MQRVALVTGASRGIGAATAQLLAKRGYAVAVNYQQSKHAAESLVTNIQAEGGTARAFQADMASESAIVDLFAKVKAELGPVNALVNNAGINGGPCSVVDINANRLESVFSTNVFGTYYCLREAIKHMQEIGGGNIVNVTSEAAKFGGTNIAHYAASKAAINTLTIAVAREVATAKIRVNAVSPGVIDTDIHQDSSPERMQNLLKSLPMARLGTTIEVANCIVWLLSDESSYLSGAIVPVTGAR